MKLRVAIWILVALLGLGGVVAVSTWAPDGLAARLGLGFTIVAALAAIVGTALTGFGNRTALRGQQEVATKQAEMAADIKRLAELTESSLEEARAQSPDPFVQFLIGDGRETTDSVVVRRVHDRRQIDVDSIVEKECALAMASLRAADTPPEPTPKGTLGAIPALARLAQMNFGLEAITADDRKNFENQVNKYENSLREWLSSFEEWREEMHFLFVAQFCFDNKGRVPARDLRIELRFPDGFEPVEDLPELERPPRRPQFQRRNYADILAGLRSPVLSMPELDRFPLPKVDWNVSSPRYRDGSCIVEFEVKKVLHGVREETDEPVTLRMTEDGLYEVPWAIRAENLSEPTRGVLRLEITTVVEDGPAITTLDELRSATPREDENEEGEEDPED